MEVWKNAQLLPLFRIKEMGVYQDCLDVCAERDASYFGIDSGTMCWCANELPRVTLQRSEFCKPCHDQPEFTCGDVHYGFASIYRIEVV